MIGRTNAGSSKSLALIRVLYSAGTTCTCSNGMISYTSDPSGDYLFGLPSAGNWTVTGVDSKGVTKTITYVIARGDAKLVLLDTLIPPEYRATYQEVEYLQILDEVGNIPLGINGGTGIWKYEVENFTPVELTTASHVIGTFISGSSGGSMVAGSTPSLRYGSQNKTSSTTLDFGVAKKLTLVFKAANSGQTYTSPYASLKLDDSEIITSTSIDYLNTGEAIVGWVSDGSTTREGFRAKFGRITIGHKTKEEDEYETVGNFVPCVQRPVAPDTEGLPGYFNLVTNTFMQAKRRYLTTKTDVLLSVKAGPAIGT